MSKKNATEQLKRYISNDLLDGATQSVLVQKITEDAYGVGLKYSVHTAKDIISECRRILRDDWKEERETLREMQLNRLLDLYTESREAKDRLTALNTLKEINKVTGQYEPIRVDATIDGTISIDFGFDKEE